MVNDPIGDFLTRVRNAITTKKDHIEVPSSNILVKIAEILKSEGFVEEVKVIEQKPQNFLDIKLKYVNGQPAITGLRRMSRPGRRIYKKYTEIDRVRRGLGVDIYSTPEGLVTDSKARKMKVGGEHICRIF